MSSQQQMSAEAVASGKKAMPIGHSLAGKLLVVCSLIFALWIAGLVAMYVTTVYMPRHAAGLPATKS